MAKFAFAVVIAIPGRTLAQDFIPMAISMNYKPDLCLDLAGGDTTNGNKVELWACNGSPNQQWTMADGDNAIRWANDLNKCIDAGDMQDGTAMWIWDCNGYDQQVFGYDSSASTIYLTNTATSADATMCMDIDGGGTTDGTAIVVGYCNALWRQLWTRQSGSPIWLNGADNFCLDNADGKTDNGNPVQILPCNGAQSQKWIISWTSTNIRYGGDPTKCIDAGNMWDGTTLMLWDCNGLDQQVWGYDGNMLTLYLSNSESDASLCLDLPGGSAFPAVQMEVWDCNGCWNQEFIIGGLAAGKSIGAPRKKTLGKPREICPPVPR